MDPVGGLGARSLASTKLGERIGAEAAAGLLPDTLVNSREPRECCRREAGHRSLAKTCVRRPDVFPADTFHMHLDLSGRVAIVTGASRGIGKSVALTLARAGGSVCAVARGDHAAGVADEIVAGGGRAIGLAADLTDAASIDAAVRHVQEQWGRVDVLVNNAGITRDQLMLRMKREDWDAVIQTNLTGAFLFSQAALKVMVRQRYGRIVSISSVVGQTGNPGQTNYAASKAGLIGFSKALAREVASRNITVNVVAPGFIDTDMTRAVAEAVRAELIKGIPLGRLGAPEDIAHAVCFLASEAASYITGHVLAVNGGMYC